MGRPAKYASEAERRAAKNARERERFNAMTPDQRRQVVARKARSHPKPKVHQNIVLAPSRAPERQAPQRPCMESVDDYLKRGGRIERLPMHAVSQPLRRIA